MFSHLEERERKVIRDLTIISKWTKRGKKKAIEPYFLALLRKIFCFVSFSGCLMLLKDVYVINHYNPNNLADPRLRPTGLASPNFLKKLDVWMNKNLFLY